MTNQIADVRLCEGFAENDSDVEYIVPYVFRKDNLKKSEIFSHYGLKTQFKIKIQRTLFWQDMPEWINMPVLYFLSLLLSLRIILTNYRRLSDVVIISRNPHLLVPALALKKLFSLSHGPKVIYWVHEALLSKKIFSWVYRNADGGVGTNSAITGDISSELSIPQSKLTYSLNPITEYQFHNVISREDARKKLSINGKKPLVVYTGKLGKGLTEIEYILKAASLLPEYQFLLTGGRPETITFYENWCRSQGVSNVSFTGFLHNYDNIRYYQFASDVLISYYSNKDHLVRYNLPNKMCEYMLTRSPIVTCDFPATRDLLNNSNVIFIEPEKPECLALGIKKAVEDKEVSKAIAEQAFRDVKEITFKKRTRILLDFFKSL